jgi:hypothetical protein
MRTFSNRKGKGAVKELTTSQKAALWMIDKADAGVDSAGQYQVNGKWQKADARTIVALVARGLLEGEGGSIRPTPAGRELAKQL